MKTRSFFLFPAILATVAFAVLGCRDSAPSASPSVAVSEYFYAEQDLAIDVKVSEPFDEVAVAELPGPGAPWYLVRMDVSEERADEKRLARIALTLRREDESDLRGYGVTHVDLPVFAAAGRHGVVRISIDNGKVADGAPAAVTAALVDVKDGSVGPEARAKRRREVWAGHLESWLKHGHYVGDEAVRVEALVKELHAAAGPVPPRLVKAELWKGEPPTLAIEFFDDSLSVAAYRIRESVSGAPPFVEDYEYPKGAWSPHGLRFSAFEPRTKNQRKDPAAWKRWAAGECGPADPDPVMWITLPTDSCRVDISLVDQTGVETDRLPLRLVAKAERTTQPAARPQVSASSTVPPAWAECRTAYMYLKDTDLRREDQAKNEHTSGFLLGG